MKLVYPVLRTRALFLARVKQWALVLPVCFRLTLAVLHARNRPPYHAVSVGTAKQVTREKRLPTLYHSIEPGVRMLRLLLLGRLIAPKKSTWSKRVDLSCNVLPTPPYKCRRGGGFVMTGRAAVHPCPSRPGARSDAKTLVLDFSRWRRAPIELVRCA